MSKTNVISIACDAGEFYLSYQGDLPALQAHRQKLDDANEQITPIIIGEVQQ